MKKIIALFFALTSVSALAQTTFLGIPLDRPFPGDIHECPKQKDFNMVDQSRIKSFGLCFIQERDSQYSVYNSPDLGIRNTLMVETYDAVPLDFKMIFSKDKFGQAVAIFTRRYGKPDKSYQETARTGSGRTFDSHTSIWNRPDVNVRLDEVGADVRWSDATIVNVRQLKEKLKRQKDEGDAAASKL